MITKRSNGGVILRSLSKYGYPKFLDTENPHARPIHDNTYHNEVAEQYISAGYNNIPNYKIPEPAEFGNQLFPLIYGRFLGTKADKAAINKIIDYKLTDMINKWRPPPLAGSEYRKTKRHFIKLQRLERRKYGKMIF